MYHLNEGDGTVAKDSAPNETPNDGEITELNVGSFWTDGVIPGTKVLSFTANGGHVNVGALYDPSGHDHMSFGGWFTPRDDSGEDATYIFYRSSQFYLRYDGANHRIAAGLNVGAQQYEIFSPVGSCLEDSRNFVMVVYDGSTLKMYHAQLKAPTVLAEASVSGNVDACASDVLFAETADIVISEFMLWTRALGAQEVQELYFFPLIRLVRKGAAATAWTLAIDASPPSMGTTDPAPDSYEIPVGEDVEVERCRLMSLTMSSTSGYSMASRLVAPTP